jgi:hypothetical protein
MNKLERTLQEYFLDFFNNYLSVEKFAEHNNLPYEDACQVLDIGKRIHEDSVRNNEHDTIKD